MYFDFSFTVMHIKLHRAGSALTEEQLGQHEILRRHGGLRAPPQDDIVFLEGGCAPFTPAYECLHSFLNDVRWGLVVELGRRLGARVICPSSTTLTRGPPSPEGKEFFVLT